MLKIIELSATIDHKVNKRHISELKQDTFRSCGKLQKSLYDACLFKYSEEFSGNKIKHNARDSRICETSKMSEFTPSLIVSKYKNIFTLFLIKGRDQNGVYLLTSSIAEIGWTQISKISSKKMTSKHYSISSRVWSNFLILSRPHKKGIVFDPYTGRAWTFSTTLCEHLACSSSTTER